MGALLIDFKLAKRRERVKMGMPSPIAPAGQRKAGPAGQPPPLEERADQGVESRSLPRLSDLLVLIQIPTGALIFGLMLDTSNTLFPLRQ